MTDSTRTQYITIFIGLLFLVNFVNYSKTNVIASPKIVIVGAGVSGIAAATKLYGNGFTNITILEAENRIGGRLYSTQLGDYVVDIGGQWVHGEKGNVAFELANPLGVLDKSFKYEIKFFDSLGNLMSDQVEKIVTDFEDKYLTFDNFEDGTNKSYSNFMLKKFDEEFKNKKEIYNEKQKYLRNFELTSIIEFASESWNDLSISNDYKYHEYSGNENINWKNRSYTTILDILLKRFPEPRKEIPILEKTILNSEVTSIDYTKNKNSNKIEVKTISGKVYEADHVIVTTSLGVLKEKYETMFNPALPNSKVEAIKYLGFGKVGKIFVLFDKPFWKAKDDEVTLFNIMWNDNDRQLIENSEKEWIFGMSAATTVEYKPNLLECWISGKYVKMMENLPDDKILEHTMEVFRRFFGKTYKITKPIKMTRSQWYSNPHFRGTYSYRTVESDEKKVTADLLEQPVDEENLSILFAGEATNIDRFSTVDGAISSGWKAAGRLISHYKKLR